MPSTITPRTVVTFALLSAAILSPSARGEDTAAKKEVPSEARIGELISQLGSDDFATREAAAKELTRAGSSAFDALDTAKKSDDPEVRLRAKLIEQQIVSRAVKELEKLGVGFLPGQRKAPLRLGFRMLTDNDLKHVGCLRSLETLELTNSPMTDEGLAHLRLLTNLRGLMLGGTQITDAGLQHLIGMKQLIGIDLNGCTISDDGLATIGTVSTLQSLSISGSQVTDKGLAHLQHLTSLRQLYLYRARVTGVGFRHLKPLGKSLERLRLYDMPLTSNDLEPLQYFTRLRSLTISGASITTKGLTPLSKLSMLRSVSLRNCGLGDGTVTTLARFPSLEVLSVVGNKFTVSGLRGFKNAPKLKAILIGREFSEMEMLELREDFKRIPRPIHVNFL